MKAEWQTPSAAWRFTRTYRDDHKYVRGVVRRLGIPEGDVDDAVQDVFVVLHDRLDSLDQRAPLRVWLRTVAARVCQNRRRSHARRRRREASTHEESDLELPDPRQSPPDESVQASETRRELLRALDRLDEAKREVLVLTALEGRTAHEIAALVDVSPNTVSSRLRAARKSVQATMTEYAGGALAANCPARRAAMSGEMPCPVRSRVAGRGSFV